MHKHDNTGFIRYVESVFHHYRPMSVHVSSQCRWDRSAAAVKSTHGLHGMLLPDVIMHLCARTVLNLFVHQDAYNLSDESFPPMKMRDFLAAMLVAVTWE